MLESPHQLQPDGTSRALPDSGRKCSARDSSLGIKMHRALVGISVRGRRSMSLQLRPLVPAPHTPALRLATREIQGRVMSEEAGNSAPASGQKSGDDAIVNARNEKRWNRVSLPLPVLLYSCTLLDPMWIGRSSANEPEQCQ